MITTHCQRWRRGASIFRPAGERFDQTRHDVVVLTERDAKDFCAQHHYSGSMPAARFRVGLLRKMPNEPLRLAGVAVFSVPMQPAVLTKHLKADVHTGAELGRFVLTDAVEGNGRAGSSPLPIGSLRAKQRSAQWSAMPTRSRGSASTTP